LAYFLVSAYIAIVKVEEKREAMRPKSHYLTWFKPHTRLALGSLSKTLTERRFVLVGSADVVHKWYPAFHANPPIRRHPLDNTTIINNNKQNDTNVMAVRVPSASKKIDAARRYTSSSMLRADLQQRVEAFDQEARRLQREHDDDLNNLLEEWKKLQRDLEHVYPGIQLDALVSSETRALLLSLRGLPTQLRAKAEVRRVCLHDDSITEENLTTAFGEGCIESLRFVAALYKFQQKKAAWDDIVQYTHQARQKRREVPRRGVRAAEAFQPADVQAGMEAYLANAAFGQTDAEEEPSGAAGDQDTNEEDSGLWEDYNTGDEQSGAEDESTGAQVIDRDGYRGVGNDNDNTDAGVSKLSRVVVVRRGASKRKLCTEDAAHLREATVSPPFLSSLRSWCRDFAGCPIGPLHETPLVSQPLANPPFTTIQTH
jgi:hypothetical protein